MRQRTTRTNWINWICSCLLLIASAPAAAGELRGILARAGDGAPMTAKIYVEDARGGLHVVPGEPGYKTQEWYAGDAPRFSYAAGSFALPLPRGKYRVTAMKGFGYRDWEGFVEIGDGTTHLRIEMEELIPLEKRGWYCGDLHIHGKTTLPMMRAEDVNLAAHTIYSSNRPRHLRVNEEQSDATHITCTNQEIEHWYYGNVFYFNLPTTVQDPPRGDPPLTPMFHYDRQSHRMGGINIRWLRSRPFTLKVKKPSQRQPELAVSAALGFMDVWSVLDNSMQEALDKPRNRWTGKGWGRSPLYEHTYLTWYRFLNCGLRIPASAGTSYGRLSRLGFNRVYVRCPGGLSVEKFAEALGRGDGFVSNGPLLWMRAGGKLPGEGVALHAPENVQVSVELTSKYPLETVEILRNGAVIHREDLTGTGDFLRKYTLNKKITIGEPSWLAARCFGTYSPRYHHSIACNQFAHTNPLFVTVAGKKPSSAPDAARFLKEVEELISHATVIPDKALRAAALQVFQKARRFYANLCGK